MQLSKLFHKCKCFTCSTFVLQPQTENTQTEIKIWGKHPQETPNKYNT